MRDRLPEAVARVRSGATYKAAAEALGLDPSVVRRACIKEGVASARPSPEAMAAACRARSNAVWAKATAADRKAHGASTRAGIARSAEQRRARTRAGRVMTPRPRGPSDSPPPDLTSLERAQHGQRGSAGSPEGSRIAPRKDFPDV